MNYCNHLLLNSLNLLSFYCRKKENEINYAWIARSLMKISEDFGENALPSFLEKENITYFLEVNSYFL